MIVDERDHHFARRSSSAWAKYAEAFFRISFARRSAKFSRSSCFSRCRSSVVSPGRWPARAPPGAPSGEEPQRCTRVSHRPTGSHSIAIRAPPHAPAPSGRLVHAVPGNTCSVVPWATSSLGLGPPINPVRFTMGATVMFALSNSTAYIRRADGTEYRLRVVKRRTKPRAQSNPVNPIPELHQGSLRPEGSQR
jgi:hypothetical protein